MQSRSCFRSSRSHKAKPRAPLYAETQRCVRPSSFSGARPGTRRGVTLIEILVILFIVAVLTGIGVAYLNPDNPQLKSTAYNLETFLYKAKSEAIKRNVSAKVTFDNATECLEVTADGQSLSSFCTKEGTTVTPSVSSISFSPTGTVFGSNFILQRSGKQCEVQVQSSGRIFIDGDCPQ